MESLFFELPTGLRLNGETHRNVELLRTNGVAEKVFVKKLPEKPITWQGNILSIATKRIGTIEVGSEVRRKYQEDGSVTIPLAILKLPLAEVNTMLVEIHRRVWESKFPRQEIICKYCNKKLWVDIDLDKIDYLPETKEAMNAIVDYEHIKVTLANGFIPPVIPKITDKEQYQGLTDTEFNSFVFRVPLLEDAIRHEKYFSDSITFWRRIAMDCLVAVNMVDERDEIFETLPKEFHTYYGLKIFNEYLTGKDLKNIRNSLLEYLPTLPFAYYEQCGCDENQDIPMVMEASNFFSE